MRIFIILFIISMGYAITYDKAKQNFYNKNYKKAYEQFNTLLKASNYSDKDYNYYIGVSAYKLKLYHSAIGAFERILFYKPNNEVANLELAKIYFDLKQFDESLYYVKNILNHSKNPKFLKEANIYLHKIEIEKHKNILNIIGIVGIGYDSNINNNSNNDILVNNTTIKQKKEGKFFGIETAIIDDTYRYQNFDIQNNILIYNKNVLNNPANNLSLLEYKPSIKYKNTNTGLIGSYLRYSNHSYMEKFGVFSQIKIKSHKFEFQYYQKQFLQKKYSFRDASHIMTNDVISYKKNNHYLYSTIQIDVESAKKGSTSSSDYDSLLLKLKDNYIFSNKFILTPIISYDFTYYPVKNALFNKDQKDNNFDFQLQTLTKFKKFDIQTNLEYTKNISNINLYEYDKWILSVNIIKQFKGL